MDANGNGYGDSVYNLGGDENEKHKNMVYSIYVVAYDRDNRSRPRDCYDCNAD